jgi:hypothetical protein
MSDRQHSFYIVLDTIKGSKKENLANKNVIFLNQLDERIQQ